MDTPVGMLRYLTDASHIGPLTLYASFVTEAQDTPRSTPTLADTAYPSLSYHVLARISGMHVDPDTAIFGSPLQSGTVPTPLVSVLSTCRRGLFQIAKGSVQQVVPLGCVPSGAREGGWSAVSTQGGIHHLLCMLPPRSGEEDTPLATVYRVGKVGNTIGWERVQMDITQPAAALLRECRQDTSSACVLMGRDSDTGALTVAVGAADSLTHLLHLDTSNPTPTLSVYCEVTSPIPAKDVSHLSCCGGVARLSSSTECAKGVSVCLRSGAVYSSKVEAAVQVSSSIGTVFHTTLSESEGDKAGWALQVAVRDTLCVPLSVDAVSYAVHGTHLIYTDLASNLRLMDLSPLMQCTMLKSADESDVLRKSDPLPWLDDGTSSLPFPPSVECSIGNRLVVASLATESLDVVELAEFNYSTSEWSVSLVSDPGVATLPLVSTEAIVVGECMYAEYKGRLLAVPLDPDNRCTTMHPLSLIGQPLYSSDSQCIVLPTATGMRVQRVVTGVAVGEHPIVSTAGGRRAIGECVGSTCVDGIISENGGCYCVRGGVWSEMDGKAEKEREQTSDDEVVRICCQEDLLSQALSPSSSCIEVERVAVEDALSKHRLDGWKFNNCSFTDISLTHLSKCEFTECDLNHCDLHGASLLNCTFTRCNLSGIASVSGATIVNITFKECDTPGMSLKGCTLIGDNLLPLVDKTNLDLTSDDFKDNDVSRWDMTGSRVTGVDMSGVKGLTVEQIGSLSSITQCNFSTMSLCGVDLSRTDVTDCDFSSGGLEYHLTADNETEATHYIVGANLTGADFTGSTLDGVDFGYADLRGVTGLTSAHIRSAKSVKGASLAGLDLSGCDLSEICFEGCDLRGCNVEGSTFLKKHLKGAILDWTGQDVTIVAPTIGTWSKALSGSQCHISNDNRDVQGGDSWAESQAVGDAVYSSGVHTWTVTVVDTNDATGFGVCGAAFNVEKTLWTETWCIGKDWGFNAKCGSSEIYNGFSATVTLDMDERSLTVTHNGSVVGAATGLPAAVRSYGYARRSTLSVSE
ncbi:hypothetical protein KIPB_006030 [Kipferlia bialata]|uniref:Uncharacterized protein n=1 Tax=Kipferlia bialata TaxID=797122 RepID=A0A9K3GIY0_9EUKA|nr:hypothetical protein KIPB_006030 [Kipferlia bialata]|eukprot:g6030.t1